MVWLGIDIGASLAKHVVYDSSKGKILHKRIAGKKDIDENIIKSIIDEADREFNISKIRITGGKSKIISCADSRASSADEIAAIAKGALFLSKKPSALVVSLGTGTPLISADEHSTVHLGGTALGGGTVEIKAGTYRMGNAVHIRSDVRLVGEGERTILLKNPSFKTELIDDVDWYDTHAVVKDPSGFEIGGGLLLQGKYSFSQRTIAEWN
jgi:hypothetical protein